MATVIAVRSAPATCVQWWVRPFAIFGADLPPNLVLMAKVIVFAILLQSQLPLSSHFLPFLPIFDSMGSPVVFHRVLVLAFFAGCAALFFTRQASAAAGVLGVTILVSILASRPFFSNNLTYCGALLFLIGLQPANRENRLLRLQVVLLYLAAGNSLSIGSATCMYTTGISRWLVGLPRCCCPSSCRGSHFPPSLGFHSCCCSAGSIPWQSGLGWHSTHSCWYCRIRHSICFSMRRAPLTSHLSRGPKNV
jgi:hypothetical protein